MILGQAGKMAEKMPEKGKHRKLVTALAVIAVLALLGVPAGIFSYRWYQDNVGMPPDEHARVSYEALHEKIVSEEPVPVSAPEEETTYAWDVDNFEAPDFSVDFDTLLEINEDCIGWLYAPQFGISYPIVQENFVDEYVHLTFEREESEAGCIFMDIISNPEFFGYSDFLFGHNMRDRTMFGPLKRVTDPDGIALIEANPCIYVYTPDKIICYRIFGFYRTERGSDTYRPVNNDEEYDVFLPEIQALSEYPCPEDISFEDRPEILTLSTCYGMPGSDARLVIHTVTTGVKHLAPAS